MHLITSMILRIGIIELFFILFVLANTLTCALYILDKRKAQKSKWRISENILIFFTLACGGIGALLGMLIAKHKTKRLKFRIAVAFGLLIATIPLIHIVHAFTLSKS